MQIYGEGGVDGDGDPEDADPFNQEHPEKQDEKKGHSAAFMVYAKRFIRVVPGEVMYFKPGEENNDANALSIIRWDANLLRLYK